MNKKTKMKSFDEKSLLRRVVTRNIFKYIPMDSLKTIVSEVIALSDRLKALDAFDGNGGVKPIGITDLVEGLEICLADEKRPKRVELPLQFPPNTSIADIVREVVSRIDSIKGHVSVLKVVPECESFAKNVWKPLKDFIDANPDLRLAANNPLTTGSDSSDGFSNPGTPPNPGTP